jgi:hypothetical protein
MEQYAQVVVPEQPTFTVTPFEYVSVLETLIRKEKFRSTVLIVTSRTQRCLLGLKDSEFCTQNSPERRQAKNPSVRAALSIRLSPRWDTRCNICLRISNVIGFILFGGADNTWAPLRAMSTFGVRPMYGMLLVTCMFLTAARYTLMDDAFS